MIVQTNHVKLAPANSLQVCENSLKVVVKSCDRRCFSQTCYRGLLNWVAS